MRDHAPRKDEERDTGGHARGEGKRGDEPVAALCRKEGIHANVYYTWLKEFMEAGKARLKGEETRGATQGEVDHLQREIEALLNDAASLRDPINRESYERFRAGILRHIWQEEKILRPLVRRQQGEVPFVHAARLRLDHGAIAALLVPGPTMGIVNALRTILAAHNDIEKDENGFYDTCDVLAGPESAVVLFRVHEAPEISTMPFNDAPFVVEATRRAVGRAGYDFDKITRVSA